MTDPQTVEDLLARLERERLEADRLYNIALTALDRALQTAPALPAPPRAYDPSRLPDVNAAWEILPGGAPVFDSSWRGRLGRFVWRLVGPALEQQQRFNAAVADHLNRNVSAHQETVAALGAVVVALRDHTDGLVRFEHQLLEYLRSITLYVDTKDRSLGGAEIRQRLALTEQRLLALKRELEMAAVNGASTAPAPGVPRRDASVQEPTASPTPAFTGTVDSLTYVAFEDQFRGASSEIRRRVADYVPLFAGAQDVLDVGCGRGELLDALRESGVSVRGVDVSPAMVELCRSRGFDVALGDALGYVSSQEDGSLGGLIAIQVVEHFTPAYLVKFLEAAFHAMRPGAPLVLETINPNCWMAFFETYIRDLTHQHPLHPDTLRHLVQASGFSQVDVQFRAPVSEDDRLANVALPPDFFPAGVLPLIDAINDHAAKLNRRLFSSMDYAVVARR
ncbi:MAG: methyltransferase domain-containing protein [Acidobacteria bacterium]|nr:methyltransferase domain-containing protein [Acidobacteriota bacterium]